MKDLFRLLLLITTAVYLGYAGIDFFTYEDRSICKGVDIVIADSAKATLICTQDVEGMLREHALIPTGRTLKQARILDIEKMLQRVPFIRDATCLITADDRVRILIAQRLPLLRIMAENGDDYYIDAEGKTMAAGGYEADLPIVTGNFDKRFAQRQLLALGNFLRNNTFWGEQIVQIVVTPKKNIDLIMRVGNAVVHLGEDKNLSTKFRNLRAFYDKVLPKVGWYKYEGISVAYENQVIGIKSETEE